MDALKPCPFCGYPEIVAADTYHITPVLPLPVGTLILRMKQDRGGLNYVYCAECDCCGPLHLTEEGAREEWNQRRAKPLQ